MNQVIIGLGSNLSGPKQQLQLALNTLASHKDVSLLKTSSFYRSKPQGPQDQDDFINAAVLLETALSPRDLLALCKTIEDQQGRVKTRHWGERNIDLDILFYGQQRIELSHPDLVIPHRHALERDFVVIPVLELAPLWSLPDGTLLREHVESCLGHSLVKED